MSCGNPMNDRDNMNGRNNMRPCRRDLLNAINEASFAVDDVKLFLDTHPTNQEAIAGRVFKVLWSSERRFFRYDLYRQVELDSRTMAMAGRRMLVYVEL